MRRYRTTRLALVAAVATGLFCSGLSAASAAPQADQDWRCTVYGSHSTMPGPGQKAQSHFLAGARTNGGGPVIFTRTRRYWLHEEATSPTSAVFRYKESSYATCSVLGSTVTVLNRTWEAGNRPCTETGDYFTSEGDAVMAYRFVGQKTSTSFNPITQTLNTYLYRFWHKEKQGSPGSFSWQASTLAYCPAP